MLKKIQNYLSLAFLLLLNTGLNAQAGTLDSTFNGDGIIRWKVPGQYSEFARVCLQSDSKILAIGYRSPSSLFDNYTIVHRFLQDGAHDPDFADNGVFQSDWGEMLGFEGDVQENGNITLLSTAVLIYHGFVVSGLQPNGSPDPNFGIDGEGNTFTSLNFPYVGPYIRRMSRQADQKIVGFGNYLDYNLLLRRGIVMRFLPNGQPDSTFSQDGIAEIAPNGPGLHLDIQGGKVQPDGKILAIGNGGGATTEEFWFITRLMPDGTVDSTFGNYGIVQKDLGLLQYEQGTEIALMSDGRFVAVGHAQKIPGQHFTLLRFLPDGKLDNTFGFGGKAQVSFDCCYSSINDVIFQPDGKILACGWSLQENSNEKIAVARLNVNGSLDQSFGTQGKVLISFDHGDIGARANTMALQPDGKILICGLTDTIAGNQFYNRDAVLVRLNGDGQVETENPTGFVDYALSVSPNPVVGPTLDLGYSLDAPAEISLEWIDMLGRKIAEPLALASRPEGRHHEQIDLPAQIPNGAYLLAFRTNLGLQYHKIVVNR